MGKAEPKIDLDYSCEECRKVFVQKSRFEKHRRLHTCRMRTCDRCGKEFASNFNRRIHMENNTCVKQKLQGLETQRKYPCEKTLNPELKCRPKTAGKHFQEAKNIQPTSIINPQPSQDHLFFQQVAQPGPYQDQNFWYIPSSGNPEGDSHINFHQGQGYSSSLQQDRTHFGFNNRHDVSTQQTAHPDPILNWQTAQLIPSESQAFLHNQSFRPPEGVRNFNFQQEQGNKCPGTDDTFNVL